MGGGLNEVEPGLNWAVRLGLVGLAKMKMSRSIFGALLFLCLSGFSQVRKLEADPAHWFMQKTDTLDYGFGDYLGKPAFFLKRNIANYKSGSVAYPTGLNFKDGIIDLDIAVPAGKNGFAGIAFRIKDNHHYETVYFRPGGSGTINAIQYMPEKGWEFNWWDYEKDKFQARAEIPTTGWFHVRAVVKGRTLKVFLNNAKEPVMVRDDLDVSLASGSVGFWLGNCSSGAYRNLTIRPIGH